MQRAFYSLIPQFRIPVQRDNFRHSFRLRSSKIVPIKLLLSFPALEFCAMSSSNKDLGGTSNTSEKEAEKMGITGNSCFLAKFISASIKISEKAGQIIKDWTRAGSGKTYNKGPKSIRDVCTDADYRAQDCIISSLRQRFGEKLCIIGEENITLKGDIIVHDFDADALKTIDSNCPSHIHSIKAEEVVIWVDPLDGTYELVAAEGDMSRQQEVTVLIGLAYKGEALAGVIHQPFWGENSRGRTIWGIVGMGVYGINVVEAGLSERYIVTSRSHTNEHVIEALNCLKANGFASDIQFVGGAGFKVIKVLEGAAAYVFASPGCKKWDTCAPSAVLHAAGGFLTDISGRKIYYGADAQHSNSGGVLATPLWISHKEIVEIIPRSIKDMLPESHLVDRSASSS